MQCTFLPCQMLGAASVPDEQGKCGECGDKRAQIECVYVWDVFGVLSMVGGAILLRGLILPENKETHTYSDSNVYAHALVVFMTSSQAKALIASLTSSAMHQFAGVEDAFACRSWRST
jgi:hypothetical protein